MAKHKHVHFETVYVVGSHDEFITAVGDKMQEVGKRYPDQQTYDVEDADHALAFGPDGKMYWSAFLRIVVTRETDE